MPYPGEGQCQILAVFGCSSVYIELILRICSHSGGDSPGRGGHRAALLLCPVSEEEDSATRSAGHRLTQVFFI